MSDKKNEVSIKDDFDSFITNIKTLGKGYESWGKVSVQRIAVRDGQRIYHCQIGGTSSPKNSDGEASIEDRIIATIFSKRKNVNCILITRQEYASTVSEEIPPILDDQAQLLGVSVRIADVATSNENKGIGNVLKSLKGRYAAVCNDGQCICIGATVDDAYIAAQLLEKTSKAFLEAKYLGGAKSINRLEAWAMQLYYQFKYAKEAKKNR
jgi:ribulose-5-phosphate 4-epimerase/fuculose-1-phosphate aldolase